MMASSNSIALIIGVSGQDGAYLAQLLLKKGYVVYGSCRNIIDKVWRLDALEISESVNLIEINLGCKISIGDAFKKIRPNEIYHLAGESSVIDSFHNPDCVINTNTIFTVNILEVIRNILPESRLFFASSSETFKRSESITIINELSDRGADSPYAISKLASDYFINLYREKYNLFACSGFLFNHESHLRGENFVTKKITSHIARIKLNIDNHGVELGNFNTLKDWGSAIDYVNAMMLILKEDTPDDFVISSGRLHSVRDVINFAALSVGFNPKFEGTGVGEVCIDRYSGRLLAKSVDLYFRNEDHYSLVGDPSKIISKTGWRRNYNLEKTIYKMVEFDLNKQRRV